MVDPKGFNSSYGIMAYLGGNGKEVILPISNPGSNRLNLQCTQPIGIFRNGCAQPDIGIADQVGKLILDRIIGILRIDGKLELIRRRVVFQVKGISAWP